MSALAATRETQTDIHELLQVYYDVPLTACIGFPTLLANLLQR